VPNAKKPKPKDPAAIARGKKSAAARSDFERQQIAARGGRSGGARRRELSPEERSRLAKLAAEARWKDRKKLK
jgi:hypothetical protein